MKKPSSKLREEIAKLQEQLRAAETKEAERIGRVALKAGLGEIEIDDAELLAAFEELTARFRKAKGLTSRQALATVAPGAAARTGGEA